MRSRCLRDSCTWTLDRDDVDAHPVQSRLWFSSVESMERGNTLFTLFLLEVSGTMTRGIVGYGGNGDGVRRCPVL